MIVSSAFRFIYHALTWLRTNKLLNTINIYLHGEEHRNPLIQKLRVNNREIKCYGKLSPINAQLYRNLKSMNPEKNG